MIILLYFIETRRCRCCNYLNRIIFCYGIGKGKKRTTKTDKQTLDMHSKTRLENNQRYIQIYSIYLHTHISQAHTPTHTNKPIIISNISCRKLYNQIYSVPITQGTTLHFLYVFLLVRLP